MTFILIALAVFVTIAAIAGGAAGWIMRNFSPVVAQVFFCVILAFAFRPYLFHYEMVAAAQWMPGRTPPDEQIASLETFESRSAATFVASWALGAALIVSSRFRGVATRFLGVIMAAAAPSAAFVIYFHWALRASFPPGDGPLVENTATLWLFIYSATASTALAAYGLLALARPGAGDAVAAG